MFSNWYGLEAFYSVDQDDKGKELGEAEELTLSPAQADISAQFPRCYCSSGFKVAWYVGVNRK